jgi:hypothetical protein
MLPLKQQSVHTHTTPHTRTHHHTHTHLPTHIHIQKKHTHTHTNTQKHLFFRLLSTSANLQRPEQKVACTIADAKLPYDNSCPSRIYFLNPKKKNVLKKLRFFFSDQKLTLHYWGRMALIHELLPVMRSSPDPRVISVLSGIFLVCGAWCVCGVCKKHSNYERY